MAPKCVERLDFGAWFYYAPRIAFVRHDALVCKGGTYRVITGMREFGFGHFNAVVDDFGSLVPVSA